MNKEGTVVKFKNFRKCLPVPIVIYCDLESVIQENKQHVPCSYGYKVISTVPLKSVQDFKVYTGQDCISKYMDDLKKIAIEVDKVLKSRNNKYKNHDLTRAEEEEFQNDDICHLCCNVIEQNDTKVRDHCHLTGKYRGPAHNRCNINARERSVVKIIFHNGSNYDFKLLVKNLYRITNDIKAIPCNEEKFIMFSVNIPNTNVTYEFLDSFRFLSESLNSLSQNLIKKDGFENLRNTYEHFKNQSIIGKGHFCYEYLDSFEKLNESMLPSHENFYSSVRGYNITSEEYRATLNMFQKLKCKTIKSYLENYLALDVLLLADVFEKFRKVSMQQYKLDPAQYYSLPGLTWDAANKLILEKSHNFMELISSEEMLYFYLSGVRGGLSVIRKRYAKANNKYMQDHDPKQKSKYIIYLDANNLYGDAMRRYLPYKLAWCTSDEIDYLYKNIMNLSHDDEFGYTLKCDIEYPQSLHDLHNDYPFLPKGRKIEKSELSDYQTQRLEKSFEFNEKLITDLHDKKEYVMDYRMLQLALKHGLKLTKIHSAVKYSQKPLFKEYVDMNTEFRKKAQREGNKFEESLYKLMNNALYGKTIENVLKRQDIKFFVDEKRKLKYIQKPNFKTETVFDENLIACHMNKMKVVFDKPFYIGFTILELSKYIMYEFVYDYLKPKYGNQLKVLGTDTDSLFLEITTEDFYEDIKNDLHERFDTSNFEEDNEFGIPLINEKELGKFKSETGSDIITEFVGIRSKMYCMKTQSNSTIAKQKGVPTNKQVRDINEYKDVLFNDKQTEVNFNRIGSKKMDIYTINQDKKALKNFDDKSYIMNDGINTMAYGHYKLIK